MSMFFSPREIVSELDRHIIGQNEAKRAVAVALRNRWRRQQLSAALKEEVVPKNILMIGPTGVGKTEIARRLAKLAQAPFIKVEATKFTEIGYVGRDVESIIRDLLEISTSPLGRELHTCNTVVCFQPWHTFSLTVSRKRYFLRHHVIFFYDNTKTFFLQEFLYLLLKKTTVCDII